MNSQYRYIRSAIAALFLTLLLVGVGSNFAQVDLGNATNNETTTGGNGKQTSSAMIDDNMTMTSAATENEVLVGEGSNMTVSYNTFTPSSIEIQAGESVTFRAAPGSTELHNVIFDLSEGGTVSDILVPFVPDKGHNHDYVLVPPFNIGEPIIQEQENGTKAIVGANKLAFVPSVVNQEGNATYLIDEEQLRAQLTQFFEEEVQPTGTFSPPQLSANHTMTGDEKVVTSGIILDMAGFGGPLEEEGASSIDTETSAEMNQSSPTTDSLGGNDTSTTITEDEEEEHVEFPGPPFIPMSSFTVTFEEPGTYPYFCAFHPAMAGVVTVTEEQSASTVDQ